MSETFPGEKFNVAAAINAQENYRKMDDSLLIPRDAVYEEFQTIYNNDNMAAMMAVRRIARNGPINMLPVTRVVRELELLLACHGNGRGLLDG